VAQPDVVPVRRQTLTSTPRQNRREWRSLGSGRVACKAAKRCLGSHSYVRPS
jgi:hypothetical protein